MVGILGNKQETGGPALQATCHALQARRFSDLRRRRSTTVAASEHQLSACGHRGVRSAELQRGQWINARGAPTDLRRNTLDLTPGGQRDERCLETCAGIRDVAAQHRQPAGCGISKTPRDGLGATP
jgi:hypothetical protein